MKNKPLPNSIWFNPLHFIAIGFGSGLLPKMPGTWGTAAGVILYYIAHPTNVVQYTILVALLFALGIYICSEAERDFEQADHPAIVFDEIVGVWIAMLGLPAEWPWILAAFILFRILDIKKPWPISWVQQYVSGGFGVMLDDAIAGAATVIALQIAHHLLLNMA